MKNFYKPIIIFAVIISIGIITGFSINHRDIKPSGSNHKVDQKNDNTIDNISNRDEDNSLTKNIFYYGLLKITKLALLLYAYNRSASVTILSAFRSVTT